MEKVFVYLLDGEVPVCFWSGNISEFTNPNPVNFRWIPMMCDLSIGEVTEIWKAGMISFKLAVSSKALNGAVGWN